MSEGSLERLNTVLSSFVFSLQNQGCGRAWMPEWLLGVDNKLVGLSFAERGSKLKAQQKG